MYCIQLGRKKWKAQQPVTSHPKALLLLQAPPSKTCESNFPQIPILPINEDLQGQKKFFKTSLMSCFFNAKISSIKLSECKMLRKANCAMQYRVNFFFFFLRKSCVCIWQKCIGTGILLFFFVLIQVNYKSVRFGSSFGCDLQQAFATANEIWGKGASNSQCQYIQHCRQPINLKSKVLQFSVWVPGMDRCLCQILSL